MDAREWLSDYLELVDLSGRIIRENKRGYIPDNVENILDRLNKDARHWIYLSQHFELTFKDLIGTAHHVRQACEELGTSKITSLIYISSGLLSL